MSKPYFSKLLLIAGLLCFLPTTRADQSLVAPLVEAPKIDSQLIDAIDGKVCYNNAIRHVDFSKIVRECLVSARLKAGLNAFGHYHSAKVEICSMFLELFWIILKAWSQQGNGCNNTTIININGMTDKKFDSEQQDITKYPFAVAIPACSIAFLLLAVPMFGLSSHRRNDLLPIALFVSSYFVATIAVGLILSGWFNNIKNKAVAKGDQEFKLLLRQAFVELCQIASKQGLDLKILAKDPLLQTEMDKLFGNNLPFGQRFGLLQSRIGKNYELISGHWENLANEARKQLESARVA